VRTFLIASANRLLMSTLPPGFKISLYARVPGARSMTLSPAGVLFVGTRAKGCVYAVVDRDNDHTADEVLTIAEGLHSPNGVTFYKGALYVAEVSRVLRFDNIEGDLRNPADLEFGKGRACKEFQPPPSNWDPTFRFGAEEHSRTGGDLQRPLPH
jgi:hypothetical protein